MNSWSHTQHSAYDLFTALLSILVSYMLLYWPLIEAEWHVTAMLHTRAAVTKSFPSIKFLIIDVLVFA